MAHSQLKLGVGLMTAVSLFVSSTAFAAPSTAEAANPWGVLSAMSGGASTAAVCGSSAAVAAAQPVNGCVLPAMDAPPPPPQMNAPIAEVPASAVGGYGITPMLLGLVALAAGVGFLLLVKGHDHGDAQPISPA